MDLKLIDHFQCHNVYLYEPQIWRIIYSMLPAYHAYTDFKVDLEEELRDICFGKPVIDFSGDEHTPVLHIACIVPPFTRFYEPTQHTERVECLIHDICEIHNIWYHMSTYTPSDRVRDLVRDLVRQDGILYNVGYTLSISHQQI